MSTWLIVIIILIYGIFEFINSIFFNWKLILLSEKKFSKAGIFAAISTILLTSSVVIATWVSVNQENIDVYWVVFLVALSMAIGNYFAALLVPKIRKKLEKNKVD